MSVTIFSAAIYRIHLLQKHDRHQHLSRSRRLYRPVRFFLTEAEAGLRHTAWTPSGDEKAGDRRVTKCSYFVAWAQMDILALSGIREESQLSWPYRKKGAGLWAKFYIVAKQWNFIFQSPSRQEWPHLLARELLFNQQCDGGWGGL